MRYLPYLGSQAVIMFLASNICLVSSGTVRALEGRETGRRWAPVGCRASGCQGGEAWHEEVQAGEGNLERDYMDCQEGSPC